MDKQTALHVDDDKKRPTPDEFDKYLPWACAQLQVDADILITKVIQNEYVSVCTGDKSKYKNKSKGKMQSSKTDVETDEKDDISCPGFQTWNSTSKSVRIYAIYDNFGNLVHVRFESNRQIPRAVMKIFNMILQFHPYLTGITINRGCNASIIYEFCRSVSLSNITDICLDNTFISEANYHILLHDHSSLRQISLARCKLDDVVIGNIAAKLSYPLPASKTLSILNLSSNRITDEGAKDLAEALRSNRQLSYLNLADNAITDTGAELLLGSLQKFIMADNEVMVGRSRYMTYLIEKNELINRMVVELKCGDFDKKTTRKKGTRSASMTPQKKGKIEKEPSLKTMTDSKSMANLDAILYDKAVLIAENMLGDFYDPFCTDNTITLDGHVFCHGNNILCYLNLAYNNISYFTLKKLLNVVLYQKNLNRRPRGLINVCIEGNLIPTNCSELRQLDEILEFGLLVHSKSLPALAKKKTSSRSGK